MGHVELANQLLQKGLLNDPLRISLVLGVIGGIPAKPEHLLHMMNSLPSHSRPNVICTGRNQFPILTIGLNLGTDVRVGMEDNIYLPKGELATNNAEPVTKIVRIAKELGKEIATQNGARTLLGIGGTQRD